jgi:hypothetical protein
LPPRFTSLLDKRLLSFFAFLLQTLKYVLDARLSKAFYIFSGLSRLEGLVIKNNSFLGDVTNAFLKRGCKNLL